MIELGWALTKYGTVPIIIITIVLHLANMRRKRKMKVLIRTTATGSEFWDAKEKRTIFVPAGKKPDFVATVNPDSMIYKTDTPNQDDVNVKLDDNKVQGEIIDSQESEEPENAKTEKQENENNEITETEIPESEETENQESGLEDLTVKELYGYAESVEVEIPKSAKTKRAIIEFLESQELE